MKRFILAAVAAILVGGAAQAQFSSSSKLVANAGNAEEIHEIFAENGMIFMVLEQGQAAVPLPNIIMTQINEVCVGDRADMVIEHPSVDDEMAVEVDDFMITIGGTETGYECPLPAQLSPYAAQVAETWELYVDHYKGEFTKEHLRVVLKEMREHPNGEFITRLDVPGGWYGNDRGYIDEALRVGNSPTGKLQGWVVQQDGIMYLVVMNNCLEICHGAVNVWHLHKPKPKPQRKVNRAPKTHTPVRSSRPMGDAPRLRCGDPC